VKFSNVICILTWISFI